MQNTIDLKRHMNFQLSPHRTKKRQPPKFGTPPQPAESNPIE